MTDINYQKMNESASEIIKKIVKWFVQQCNDENNVQAIKAVDEFIDYLETHSPPGANQGHIRVKRDEAIQFLSSFLVMEEIVKVLCPYGYEHNPMQKEMKKAIEAIVNSS